MVDDLSDAWAEIRKLQAEVRRLQNSTMLQNSSITRGALRVASAEGLVVEGSAKVTGKLAGSGTFAWTGPETHAGAITNAGTFTNNGPTNLKGAVDVTGNVTTSGTFTNNGTTNLNGTTNVKGDLNVTAPGKVKVGTAIELDPAADGGAVKFSTGAKMIADTSANGAKVVSGGGWQMYVGANGYAMNNSGVSGGASVTGVGTSLFLGGAIVNIGGANLNLNNLPTIRTASANNAAIGSVFVGGGTRAYRVIA